MRHSKLICVVGQAAIAAIAMAQTGNKVDLGTGVKGQLPAANAQPVIAAAQAPATATSYGTVKLPVGNYIPTLHKVAITGNYNDLANVPTINLSALTALNPDLGAAIATEDALYQGKSAVFQVLQPAGISTNFPVSSGHSLQVYAAVSWGAQGTFQSNTGLQCFGPSAVLTSTLPVYNPGTSNWAMMLLPAGVSKVSLRGCSVEGSYNVIALDPGYSTDLLFDGNYVHNGGIFQQSSAAAAQPSLRFHGTNNTAVMDQTSTGITAFQFYGALQESLVAQNHFHGMAHGAEFYAGDGGNYPSQAAIQALGLRDVLFTQNTCELMGYTCGWASMGERVNFIANLCTTSGDPCFDEEASSDWTIAENTAGGDQGDGAGYITTFYTSYNGTVARNHIFSTGSPGFAVHNAVQSNHKNVMGLRVTGNDIACLPAAGCAAMNLDSNFATTIDSNSILNGTLSANGYSDWMTFSGNFIKWTVAPTGAGMSTFIENGGQTGFYDRNMIQNLAGGSAPCISAAAADYNNVDTYSFTGNTCVGFQTDGLIQNSGGNGGIGLNAVFTSNILGSGTISSSSSSNAPVNIIRRGNYTLTGTTAN